MLLVLKRGATRGREAGFALAWEVAGQQTAGLCALLDVVLGCGAGP
jgi:hypothetical protein